MKLVKSPITSIAVITAILLGVFEITQIQHHTCQALNIRVNSRQGQKSFSLSLDTEEDDQEQIDEGGNIIESNKPADQVQQQQSDLDEDGGEKPQAAVEKPASQEEEAKEDGMKKKKASKAGKAKVAKVQKKQLDEDAEQQQQENNLDRSSGNSNEDPERPEVEDITIPSHEQGVQTEQDQTEQTQNISKSAVINLKNINNQQYIGEIQIGTPMQKLQMLFDTGSACIYAISDKCSYDDCPKKMDKYDSRSKSLKDTQTTQELNYGEGYVSGTIGTERICFAGGGKGCMNQVQMLVGDQGKKLDADKFTGIVGLAQQNDPNNKMSAFIDQIAQTPGLAPVFSFYLPKDQDGTLLLGGYDLKSYAQGGENDIVWSHVPSDEKTWSVEYNGVKFKDGPGIDAKSERIMMDTGLSYALVPTADVASVAKGLMGYSLKCEAPQFTGHLGLYKCSDCSEGNYKSLAPIQLMIDNKFYEMPVNSYIKRLDDGETCELLLHPYDSSYGSDSKWVLGVSFLQNYYSIYDYKQRKIGLIPSK